MFSGFISDLNRIYNNINRTFWVFIRNNKHCYGLKQVPIHADNKKTVLNLSLKNVIKFEEALLPKNSTMLAPTRMPILDLISSVEVSAYNKDTQKMENVQWKIRNEIDRAKHAPPREKL